MFGTLFSYIYIMMSLSYVPTMFLILLIAFFSIWHILIRVKLNKFPMTCNVMGPSFAAIIEQLLYSLHLNQALHLLFLQLMDIVLQFAKHVLLLCSDFMLLISSINNNNDKLKNVRGEFCPEKYSL